MNDHLKMWKLINFRILKFLEIFTFYEILWKLKFLNIFENFEILNFKKKKIRILTFFEIFTFYEILWKLKFFNIFENFDFFFNFWKKNQSFH